MDRAGKSNMISRGTWWKMSAFILIISGLGLYCSGPKQECNKDYVRTAESIVNPNGDSELALLMREMYDDVMHMKEHIEDGTSVHAEIDHELMMTAEATEPEKAASDNYRVFADAYLQSYNALLTAKSEDRKVHYNQIVNNCMTCHQSMCPGPIVKIEKLRKNF